MRKGKISELYDLAALEAQQAKVIALVSEFTDLIGRVKPVALKLDGAEKLSESIARMKEVSSSTEKISESSKKAATSLIELMDAAKNTAQGNSVLGASLDDNIKKELAYQTRLKEIKNALKDLEQFKGIGGDEAAKVAAQVQELTKEQLQLKAAASTVNTVIKAQVKELQSMPNSINEARARLQLLRAERNDTNVSTDRKEELNAAIDLLDEFVRKENDSYTQRKINIGNYQGSAKIIVDALEEQSRRLDELRQKQAGLQKLKESNPIGFQRQGGNNDLNKITSELAKATQKYEALNNVVSQPAFLTAAGNIGDARKEIRGFTTTLVQLEQQGLGGTEFANELRNRLAQLTDQVADTRQEIKALSSDSRSFDLFAGSVSFLADTFQTAAGAAVLLGASEEDAAEATKTLVAIQSVANGVKGIANELTTKGTAANKALTFAQTQYTIVTNTAATATVRFGAAMRLLAPLAILGGIILLVMKLKEWSDAVRNISQRQKVLNDISKAAADSYGQEKAKLDTLITSLKTEGLSKKEKFNIVKQLQEQFPGYFDNIKTEADLNNKLKTAYENATAGILLKAKAQAANSLLAENETKKLKLQIDYEEKQAKNRKLAFDLVQTRNMSKDKALASGINFITDITKINREQYIKDVQEIDKTNKILLDSIQDSNNKIIKLGGKVEGSEDKKEKKEKKEKKAKEAERLRAEFEAFQQRRQRQADFYKESAEDENLSYAERLMNLNMFIKAQQAIIAENAKFELGEKDLTEDQKMVIAQKAANEQIKVALDASKTLEKIELDRFEKRKSKLPNEVDEDSKMFKALQRNALKRLELADQIAAREKKLDEEAAQRKIQLAQLEADLLRQKIDLAYQAYDAIAEFSTFGFEREKNEIQGEIDALERKKAKEIEVANQSITNVQDKEAAISVIEKRSAAQRELLEQRQRETEVKKAKLEKTMSILRVAITTAEQVFKIKAAAAALTAGLPLTAPLMAATLAQIPIVIAGGALTAGLIAARPIPQYADGTDDHPGGLAVVGDGKRKEFVQTPDGQIYETPATDTVVDIPARSKVFKDESALLNAMMHQHISSTSAFMNRKPNDYYQFQNITKSIQKMEGSVVKAIKNIPQPVIQTPGRLKSLIHSNGSITEWR